MNKMPTLFNFKGKGKLTVIGQEQIQSEVDISLIVNSNSKIDIILNTPLFNKNLQLLKKLVETQLVKCSFKGELLENRKIEIPAFYIQSFTLNMKAKQPVTISIKATSFSDVFIWNSKEEDYSNLLNKQGTIKIGLSNFIFNGNQYSKYPDGSIRRDLFKINLENKEIIFKQLLDYSLIEKRLKKEKKILLTSEMEFNNLNHEETKDMIDDILWLLSFSQKTLISKSYTKLLVDDKEILLIFHQNKKYNYANASFIDTSHLNDDSIGKFLEETYNNFKINKTDLKLVDITDIICQAELSPILESKYLLLSSALELCTDVLINKNGWKIEEDEDIIKNTVNCIKKYLKENGISISEEHIGKIASKLAFKSFKKRIKATIDKLGFNYKDSEIMRIKRNRDKIVHEVKLFDYSSPMEDYNLIKLLIDKILIKLLGYNGNVKNYTNNYKLEKIV